MIIKHDRHIFLEIHKVCKGLWAFVFLVVLFGCCLTGQTNSVSLELERAHHICPLLLHSFLVQSFSLRYST